MANLMTTRASGERAKRMSVRQLRVVVETENYEQAVRFYRDVLGLPEELAFDSDGGARVTILTAGRATLELVNPAQRQMIDELEVGRQVSPRIRLAFEVRDTATTVQRLTDAGAVPVAPPTRTPWNSLNARLDAPGRAARYDLRRARSAGRSARMKADHPAPSMSRSRNRMR
jgi:catechol 2,3-dioxygenase-like lactoylglutathione lyase family enzyme